MKKLYHIPVMKEEVIHHLDIKTGFYKGRQVLDKE